jgi:uncharacterized protein (TIGR02118 family)
MIKVSVLYPNGDEATFDMDYYRDTHMAIVERTMRPSRIEIDHGDDGPYMAIGHLYFDSPDHHTEALGNMAEAGADIPNFTNVAPVVQTSRVVDR